MNPARTSLAASLAILALSLVAPHAIAADDDEDDANPLASLALRNIGPAIISGRISDFAFHPEHKHEFIAATASGNIWKTTNNTTTWTPIFDNEGSFAVGVIELDPNNPLVIWVGTGENNAQRSVAYGDGVYKSLDGGKSWKNVGLKDSGHISQIWIHPEDSNNVLVAAQGPLWNDGGDRGLYRTLDGGESWDLILEIDEHTGVNEFVVDPRNPDVIVASSYQRRRHVWVLINGGPGSGVHKTTDGGANWTRVAGGLPSDHMGRIGLAGAPSAPDTIYAIVEANEEEQGLYRSSDFGDNWEKRSDYMSTSPQYYNELVVDPHEPDRLYSLNTFTSVSEDAGKTFTALSLDARHVDDHALWIDPDNTAHLYIGGDGGIYESWDRGQTWRHVRNLPIAQFYRIQPDNAEPFYNVCGGTQDNNSLCGPSRTAVVHGVTNTDWRIILGGDGYKPQIDPTDPNIIYTQFQYGGLARYDRRTYERVFIAPHPEAGENQYKWNWNTPLLISPHNSRRLYYGAEYLFQSDDRGDTWRKISPDLTRKVNRNQLEVMGRVWGVDTIAKNNSTSIYGSLIGISESPLAEGLIYAGSDDGMISVTEDGGENWRNVTRFPGVPDMSLIEDVVASEHDADVAFAVIDNHKRGDYKPYVLRSDNRGASWKPISGNLPERGSAHTIAQDHVNPNLLFVGTEFGLFFTQDGGQSWEAMKGNFPTIAVRDLEIQRRESDLVVGTFGRGVYILDDYSPLRTPASALTQSPATLFAVKPAWLYNEGDLWDDREKGSSGAAFFTAPNPAYGAVFTYYLDEALESEAKQRRKADIELEKEGKDTPYPSWDELRAQDREEAPSVMLVVRDADGEVVRQVDGATAKGLHRTAWDMRLPAPDPVDLSPPGFRPYWVTDPAGPLVAPGEYSVTLVKRQGGNAQKLAEPQRFILTPLLHSPKIAIDTAVEQAFHRELAELYRAVGGASGKADEISSRIDHLKAALNATPKATEQDHNDLRAINTRLQDLQIKLSGDRTIGSRNEPVPMSVGDRVSTLYWQNVENRAPVTGGHRESYRIAAQAFSQALSELTDIDESLSAFEQRIERKGAPWTPGRVPAWSQ